MWHRTLFLTIICLKNVISDLEKEGKHSHFQLIVQFYTNSYIWTASLCIPILHISSFLLLLPLVEREVTSMKFLWNECYIETFNPWTFIYTLKGMFCFLFLKKNIKRILVSSFLSLLQKGFVSVGHTLSLVNIQVPLRGYQILFSPSNHFGIFLLLYYSFC